MAKRAPLLERFMDKVYRNPITGCWDWTASLTKGYAQISTKWGPKRGYWVSYELFIGQVPEGLEIDHKCRNTKCVNPEHLEAVTGEENIRRQVEFRRSITTCPEGHEFTESNTYINPKTGGRQCRECRKERSRKFFNDNPDYKKKWWSKNIKMNRLKQQIYLDKKKHNLP